MGEVRRAIRGCEGWTGFRQQQLASNRESEGGPSVCKKQRLIETCKSPRRTMTSCLPTPPEVGVSPQHPSPPHGPLLSSLLCSLARLLVWVVSPRVGPCLPGAHRPLLTRTGPDLCGLSVRKLTPGAGGPSPVRVESGPVQGGPRLLLCVTDVAWAQTTDGIM